MATPSYVSDPQIQYLSQLLDEIADGHLLVPRFQRPMVWTDEQRLELMRSVASSTPIGSIFVWRTRIRVAHYRRLGPYALKPSGESEIFTYLLDGHQRLSTLFGALRTRRQKELKARRRDDDTCWDIDYHLEEDDFVLATDKMQGHRVPMNVILDSIESIRFQRELAGSQAGDTDLLITRLDDLTAAFQRYKIPVIPIVTDDIDQAAKTLQKINSEGTPMSQVHMIHVLTWSKNFDLNQKIEEVRNETLGPLGWREISDQSILMACKLTLDLDVYEDNADEISKTLRKKSRLLDDAVSNLKLGIDFLDHHCGIRSPKLLPYEALLPLLADGLRRVKTGRPELKKSLVYWFWWSTYIGFSGGSNASRVRRQGEIVRSSSRILYPEEGMPPVDELPAPPHRHDFRNARSKALALRMAYHRQNIEGSDKPLQELNLHGAGMVQRLIPSSEARKMGARKNAQLADLLKSSANRIVASAKEVPLWRGAQGGTLSGQVRGAHLIPDIEPQNPRELKCFLEERHRWLEELEWDFAQKVGILKHEKR